MNKKVIVSRENIAEYAKKILESNKKIFTLTGSLGAGKTTLVQEMLRQLGVCGPIASPTYTYVCTYPLADGRTVYHFDLYRLSCAQDFIQAGFDEYLYDDKALCFIEWPEIIEAHLPEKNVCKVTIEYIDETKREFYIYIFNHFL